MIAMIDLTALAQPLFAFGIALTVCATSLFVLLRLPKHRLLWDIPDRANAMHVRPTPRIGGAVMAAAAAVAIGCATLMSANSTLPAVLLFTVVALIFVSFFDDKWQLSPVLRLAVHIAAAALTTLFWIRGFAFSIQSAVVLTWLLSPLGTFIIILGITWMTNLYNFMDGADGIAGGMTLFGFGSYALIAMSVPGAMSITLLSAAIAGAALGFLIFNFSPATVFMGDAGSIPLGFLAAVLGIHGSLIGAWRWWVPILVFSPFIVDASVTLLKRVLARKKIWHAHREHYYQRLILAGWSHQRTALFYYVVMLSAAASALAVQSHKFDHYRGVILAAWVVIYAMLLFILEWRFEQIIKMKRTKH